MGVVRLPRTLGRLGYMLCRCNGFGRFKWTRRGVQGSVAEGSVWESCACVMAVGPLPCMHARMPNSVLQLCTGSQVAMTQFRPYSGFAARCTTGTVVLSCKKYPSWS